MNLSSLSVRRGVTFLMAYIILTGFGLYSLSRLQLDLYPDISFPMVMVITNYTGASPEDMETLVSRPIEGAVASVKGATEISSTSKQGVSAVQVSFDWGNDMEQAETDVRRAIDLVKGFLPDDADTPMVFAFDPSMQPILMMMISGPYPLDELRNIAENELVPRVERLPGIASANVEGGLEREIQVVLDPARVQALGLDVNAVVAAIYRENIQAPGGAIEQGPLDFTIQTRGKYQSVADIGEVVVGVKQDRSRPIPLPVPVRLKELAKVRDGFFENRRVLEADGEPSVWMMVRKQSGSNTVRSAEAVMAALPEIKKSLGANIEFKVIFNQADFINMALGNLSNTALMGVGITFLVLLLFLLNVRASLIVSTAIPLSVVATFAVMDQAGITLNVLSMAGLALAIGMLVDNAIVVLENIFRLLEKGRSTWAAAIDGADTVGTAVTASTLTTISVFVPVLFVPGIAGVLFRDMAITICFSLFVSLVVARTFIPLAASRLLGGKAVQKLLDRSREQRGVFAKLRDFYGHQLDWTLRHRWLVMLGLVAAIGGAAVVAPTLRTDFVSQDDQSILFIQVETAVGNNLEEATAILRDVQKAVEEVIRPEERRLVALDVGVAKGFVSLFAKGVHAGILRVPLVPMSQRQRSQKQIEEAVRQRLKTFPGIKYSLALPFNITGNGDIEVQILGHDLQVSRRIGLELRDRLQAWPEMGDVVFSMADQKPEVQVRFDRAKMAQMGLSTAQVGNAISTYFQGRLAGRYAEGGDEFDILVRYGRSHRKDIDELRRMPVVTPTGAVVPLANIAHIDVGLGPVDITRLNQGRVTRLNLTLRAEYKDADGDLQRKDLGKGIAHVKELLGGYDWPEGFSYNIGGAAEDFMTSFRYLGIALMISILLVYMVMASQFESLRQPFIILFTVPLAGIGVVAMFAITQATLNISALVGVIMLVGIVVNNGIVMVDAANQLREQGEPRLQAITTAARVRFRPVLMTSLTTILAMVPLALGIGEGAAGWQGMAQAVIGGLIASTALTLVVVPTVYTFFAAKNYKTLAARMGLPDAKDRSAEPVTSKAAMPTGSQ